MHAPWQKPQLYSPRQQVHAYMMTSSGHRKRKINKEKYADKERVSKLNKKTKTI